MALYWQATDSGRGFWITGDTKTYKDNFKEQGGKWNPSMKAWVFSMKQFEEMRSNYNLQPLPENFVPPTSPIRIPTSPVKPNNELALISEQNKQLSEKIDTMAKEIAELKSMLRILCQACEVSDV